MGAPRRKGREAKGHREREKRVKVTLGPDTTMDTTPSIQGQEDRNAEEKPFLPRDLGEKLPSLHGRETSESWATFLFLNQKPLMKPSPP